MVSARDGYGAWQPTYDNSVQDIMDLGILETLTTVRWSEARQVVDLGCGTGRTASWLVSKGVVTIDGVDLTPKMLDKARRTWAPPSSGGSGRPNNRLAKGRLRHSDLLTC